MFDMELFTELQRKLNEDAVRYANAVPGKEGHAIYNDLLNSAKAFGTYVTKISQVPRVIKVPEEGFNW